MADPRPINHDAASTGLEVGTKALGYGAAGFLGAAAVGGLIVAGIIGLIGGAAAFGTVATIAIAAGAGAAAIAWGPIAALGGALFGTLKGASNVSREVSSYRMHSDALANNRQHTMDSRVNDAGIASMQQGYMMGHAEGKQAGVQEGAAMVIQQIQAHEQQMAQQAQTAGGFATNEAKSASKVEALTKERSEQATGVTPGRV